MKLKPKGRKIYRYKTRFERIKGFFRNTGAVVLTIGGAAVLIFVGYSVGAPVMRFLEEQNIVNAPAESAVSSPDGTDITSENSEPDVQAVSLQGYCLDAQSLVTEDALHEALAMVPEGISHIIVPLKTQGGRLYYATALEDAEMCGAVVAAVPLENIYNIITEHGYIPAASINALEDHVYPLQFPAAGYQIAGTEDSWLGNGETPWLSPFSDLAIDYLSNVTKEIADAGFSVILCDGLTFPAFAESDLNMLDPRASAADRGSSLADIVNAMQAAAGDAAFYVRIDGEAMLDGSAEILRSGKAFSADGIVVSVTAETAGMRVQFESLAKDCPCLFELKGEGSAQSVSVDGNYILHPSKRPETAETTETASAAVNE